jgi:hypothetical protein
LNDSNTNALTRLKSKTPIEHIERSEKHYTDEAKLNPTSRSHFLFSCGIIRAMPKRSRNTKDPIKNALRVVETATGGPLHPKTPKHRKNPHAVALGRKGGLKGGVARARNLTPEQRSQIAKAAAQARWKRR